MSQPRPSSRAIESSVADSARMRRSTLAQTCGWSASTWCSIAEIDGDAERATGKGGKDADPVAAEHGGEQHGREIGREENVGPDLRQPPTHGGGQCKAKQGKADRKRQRRLGTALPPSPEFIDHFCHAPVTSRDQQIQHYGRA